LAICLFRMTEYLTEKLPVPIKRATIILIKVKSCNALLRMLLVCIRNYLQSVLKYKFLLWILILRTVYLREQGYDNPRLFFKAKRGP
jgi:hypothetical protein